MTRLIWSFVLQWSRFGVNAAVFLVAARYLSLEQIGIFATAYAPVRLMQGFHKAGIAETVVIRKPSPRRLNALLGISVIAGCGAFAVLALTALYMSNPYLLALSVIPLANGIAAVSDGLLRKNLAVRRLALRTVLAQLIAATAFGGALVYGWNTGALVVFVLINAGMTAALNICLAPAWPLETPSRTDMSLTLRQTLQIALRDFANGAVIPLAQLAIGVALGMAAAGVFQIASRVLSMLDALSLAPFRYVALPRFSEQRARTDLSHCLSQTSLVAGWVWFGAFASAPELVQFIVGPAHVDSTSPVLRALLPLGLIGAIGMPFAQFLTAKGMTRTVLHRALLTCCLSAAGLAVALPISTAAGAATLPLASGLSLIWLMRRGCMTIGVSPMVLEATIVPLISGALMAFLLIFLEFGLIGKIVLGTAIYLSFVTVLGTRPLRRGPA